MDMYGRRILETRERASAQVQKYRSYAGDLKSDEEYINFTYSDNFTALINLSPYFFRDFMDVYMKLLDRGYTEQMLSRVIENKARVVKYVPQVLLPGAFLDSTNTEKEKLEFLERFATSADLTMSSSFEEPNLEQLYVCRPLKDKEKIWVGTLISALGEGCERIYFGEQQTGYTAFGLDRKLVPNQTAILQDFDLNLGVRKIWPEGKIKTITTYPFDGVSFRIIMDFYNANIWKYRNFGSSEEMIGRPPPFYLGLGLATVDEQSLTLDQIIELSEEVKSVVSNCTEILPANRTRLHLEFASTQSRPIKNLNGLIGEEWKQSDEAIDTIVGQSISTKLKKEMNLKYDVDVFVELMRRSMEWLDESVENRLLIV